MNKHTKKRAVSAEGEGPTTAETTDPLLVPSRLLRVREAWNPQYEGSLQIEKGGQGGRRSGASPLFPVKIDGKEPYQVKAITSLFIYVRTSLFQGGPPFLLLIRPFPNLSFPPHSIQWRTFLAIPSPLSLFYLLLD